MNKVVSMLLAFLLLIACVPTPEEEFVVGKANQADMIAAAKEDAAQNITDLRAQYHIPETLSLDLKSPDGVVQVKVDAPVVVPDKPLPIVRVYAAEFEQPTVTALWNTLVGDAVLYDQWENEETKADIERDLKSYTDMLEQINDGTLDEQSAMYSADELKEMIADLQSRYASAPDGYEKQVETGVLHKQYFALGSDKRAAARMGISARSEGEPWMHFFVENDTDNTEPLILQERDGWTGIGCGRAAHFYFNRTAPGISCAFRPLMDQWMEAYVVTPSDTIPEAASGAIATTPEAAFAKASQFLSDTGLDGTFAIARETLVSDRETPEAADAHFAYCIEFVRTVDGAPCARCANELSSTMNTDEMMSPYWGYEEFNLYLDDTGIFYVTWRTPLTVGDTVTEASKLLDFSEILPIAERMLPLMKVENFQPEFTKSVTRTIDRVELGLWRITEQNELGKGLLVPVYCFYGTDYFRRDLNADYSDETYHRGVVLIVNAIDGSIIDPEKGY